MPRGKVCVAWAPDGADFNDVLRAPDGAARIVALYDAAAPVTAPEIPSAAAAKKERVARKRDTMRSSPAAAADGVETLAADAVDSSPANSSSFAAVSLLPPAPPMGDESAATLANDEGTRKNEREQQIEACARLDHSDVDNGTRLISYFGSDLLTRRESGVAAGAWLHWTGKHWDIDSGAAGAALVAQQVGAIIMDEARFIGPTDTEAELIEDGRAAALELKGLKEPKPADGGDVDPAALQNHKRRIAELTIRAKEGHAARDAVRSRRQARRKHGLATKMRARMSAMLECAGPRQLVAVEAFNPDPLKVATISHTLTFQNLPDPECPDPAAERLRWRVTAERAHRRGDMITALVPIAYDPTATCPRWRNNLARFQPNEPQRRTVQQFTGLGLLGKPIQRLMFHYGSGGNFKSVFLETVTRVLGDSFAVGLPTESLIGGNDGNAGGPRPDLERLFGKRMLRILELPSGAALKADLVKKLTGGERWPIRTLYKSFYEFAPCAKTHMSGNDYPKFDGSDGGMKRRLLVVEWPEKIPESEQRDIDVVIGELMVEASGILNWMIEGALDYLNNGLVISEATRATTQDYFDEMDPVERFVRDCVEAAPGENVGAREMFDAYKRHCVANARHPIYETRFGLTMKKRFEKDDESRKRAYLNVRLHDVPTVLDEQNPPQNASYESRHRQEDDDVVPL